MEQTNKTTSDGKWLFIVRKHNVSAVVKFLDKELQEIFQTVVPKELKFDGLPIPHRAKNAASRAVGLYAAVLQGMANPQEEEDTPIQCNQNPIRAQKRQVIKIDTTTQITENTTQSKTNEYASNKDLEAKITLLREEFLASQKVAMAEIQQNLQQHLETALHSLVGVMQKELIIQINNMMMETITS
eukprot:10534997-Ditylum_brightwellii.AAC.1